MGGELVMAAARERGRWILPIDSEHSAVWQCRWGEDLTTIEAVTLTGSGGPFRELPLEQLGAVRLEDALQHPTWKMGPKITIDSATMMNKALEIIELHHLFDTPYDRIRVLIHPQSIVHSMIHFVDGSTKAQLGYPDMRVPISITLGFPERLFRHPPVLSLGEVGRLDFETPDPRRYPALELGYEAGRRGRTYPAVLNAANEVAVQLFSAGQLRFDQIVPLVERVLAQHQPRTVDSVATLMETDAWARQEAQSAAGRGVPARS
jgi:1-deoxy-D-xylulose-5-phosphate reductoisomerase